MTENDDYAPGWRPSEGDELVGELIETDTRQAEHGDYPVLTFQTDDDARVAVHAFHSVLRNGLAKLSPQVGDRVVIRYLGTKISRSTGRTFHAYRVSSDGPPKPFDWGRFGGDSNPQVDVEIDESGLPWAALPDDE